MSRLLADRILEVICRRNLRFRTADPDHHSDPVAFAKIIAPRSLNGSA
jgi:hypothetical protein